MLTLTVAAVAIAFSASSKAKAIRSNLFPILIAHLAAVLFLFDRLIQTFPLTQIYEAVAALVLGDCIKVLHVPKEILGFDNQPAH